MSEIWPNFFIVGAHKCGTTSLHEYLKVIPGIFMSTRKEPHFFSQKTIPVNKFSKPIRNKKEYLNLFQKTKDEKIIGESSTSYLYDPDAPQLIHQIAPNAKILISLRDPVTQLHSWYLHIQSLGTEKTNFADFKPTFHEQLLKELRGDVDYQKPHLRLYAIFYSEYVSRYFEIFGRNQVKTIIFEELIKNPKRIVKEILNFLGLSKSDFNFKNEAYNVYTNLIISRGKFSSSLLNNESVSKIAQKILSKNKRKFIIEKILTEKKPKSEMEKIDIDVLAELYSDDVKKLKKLLGCQLPWPNFQ